MAGVDASSDEDHPAWLVVIDPQVIFASPDSDWGSPFFAEAFANIERLAAAAGDRVLVTRWLPTADRTTSWGQYFEAWPFADKPADDPLFDRVPEAQRLSPHPTLDLPTFCKWGAELERRIGDLASGLAGGAGDRVAGSASERASDRARARGQSRSGQGSGGTRVVLAGVATDCCVISTALAAADAGARETIAADACAGSTAANHDAAMQVMGLYPPQLTVASTDDCIALLSAAQ